jgi:hypothetical protein
VNENDRFAASIPLLEVLKLHARRELDALQARAGT